MVLMERPWAEGGPRVMDMSRKIAVLTDTNCDLPPELLKKYNIFCLPLVINSGTQEYRDGIDLTVTDIYARQKKEHFGTSLPRPADLTAAFDAMVHSGYTKAVVLLLGSALSGSTNMARLMADERDDLEIAVYDTKSASIGVGILALQTALYIQRGLPFHILCQQVEQLIAGTKVFFSLDTLEYLQRGGRIGKATALAGGLLQIKPILTFDETGTINTAAKVRGSKAVPARLLELVSDYRAAHGPNARFNLVVCDGGVPQAGAALEAALCQALPGAERVVHGQLDATLAVHLGPNLLGAGIQLLKSTL